MVCWSKKKKKSEARLRLERADIVLMLRIRKLDDWLLDDADFFSQVFYLHIGFVNYSTWQMSVLPLCEVKALQGLQGNVAEREKPEHITLATSQLCDDREGLDEFQFSTRFFHSKVDFDSICSVTMYSIDDDRAVPLSEEESKSGYVRVTKYSQEFTVWEGSEAESSRKKLAAGSRKRTQEQNPGQTGKKAKRSQHRKHEQKQQMPRVPNVFDEIDAERMGVDVFQAIPDEMARDDGEVGSVEEAFEAEDGEDLEDDVNSDSNGDDALLDALEKGAFLHESSDEEFIANLVDVAELVDDGDSDNAAFWLDIVIHSDIFLECRVTILGFCVLPPVKPALVHSFAFIGFYHDKSFYRIIFVLVSK